METGTKSFHLVAYVLGFILCDIKANWDIHTVEQSGSKRLLHCFLKDIKIEKYALLYIVFKIL